MAAEAAPNPEESAPESGGDSMPAADASNPDSNAVPEEATPTLVPSPESSSSESASEEPASEEAAGPAPDPDSQNADNNIVSYDFRHPSLLAPSEVRKLSLRHDDFIRALATRLSIHLRLEFGISIASMETLPLGVFIQKQKTPTHYTLFNIDPLEGTGLLEMSPTLGLTMVDRLMGGPGNPITPNRDLTEIEKALLDQTVQILLKEWCHHVCREMETRTILAGHENNGKFLQIASNDSNMVVLKMDISMGELNEPIHLALPYDMLEPLIGHFGPLVESKTPSPTPSSQKDPVWNPALGGLKIPVVAQWTNLKVSARKLTELKVGDVLPIDSNHSHQVQVQLATITKFIGRLGKCGNSWAVELTGSAKS